MCVDCALTVLLSAVILSRSERYGLLFPSALLGVYGGIKRSEEGELSTSETTIYWHYLLMMYSIECH